MIYRSIVTLAIMSLLACGSSKPNYAIKEELQEYTGAFYVTFTFISKDTHPMTMGGIGETFDVELLIKDNLESFTESFYEQLAYSPFFDLVDNYKESVVCLGYKAIWLDRYYTKEITSNIIKEYKLKLQDSSHIIIREYKLLKDLNIKYVENFKDCIMSSSIEFDINKINSIDKVAILIDKK